MKSHHHAERDQNRLNSGLFVGHIRHRRFLPIQHHFTYATFMPAIDLDELATLADSVAIFSLKKWSLASFYPQDYLDGSDNLKHAAQQKVFELTGEKLTGKVYALCQLRYCGLYFSPVNFYYLYDDKNHWRYLLAEVSNTPWNERHYYAVANKANPTHAKSFHVSPFNPMNQQYKWKITPLTHRALVHLSVSRDQCEFDATLTLKKAPFSSRNLMLLLIKTPIMTIKVLFLIYWQALKLWLKGAPFYAYPLRSKE